MKEIKGKVNLFQFIGTYNPETETFSFVSPSTDDISFEVDDEGVCYIETNQKYEYDPETGNLYLIKEAF